MEKEKQPHDVVKVLERFGRYHWIHWFLVTLPSLTHTMMNINFVIVAGDMDYRCRIPECESSVSTHESPNWWPNTATFDKCSKPVLDDHFTLNDTCSNTSFTKEVVQCTDWIYENNNSIVSELNLACDPWKINMVGVIHNIGLLFSLLIYGWISDRFGRKTSTIVCAAGMVIGVLKIFSINYEMFVTIDFLESLVTGGMYTMTSVMLIEFSNKSSRVYTGVVITTVVCFGEILLGALAVLFPYWKHLILFVYAPSIIFFSYIFLIRESPRWQVLNGKIDEAKKTIEKIAQINKIPVNKQELDEIDDKTLKSILDIKEYVVRDGYKEILMSKEIMTRLIICVVCRFTSAFVFYGILINSMLLPGGKNLNFFYNALMSFPGELIALYCMNKFGRRMPLLVSFLLAGLLCIATEFITLDWGRITSYLLAKMLIALTTTAIATYTMELFPTSARATLIGIGYCATRVGALLSPLTPLLIPINPHLPLLLCGALSLFSCLLLIRAPETKDQPLMETIQQLEEYTTAAKKKKKHTTEMRLDIHTKDNMTQSCETVISKI